MNSMQWKIYDSFHNEPQGPGILLPLHRELLPEVVNFSFKLPLLAIIPLISFFN